MRCVRTLSLLACLGSLVGVARGEEAQESPFPDFRALVHGAKERVFPAVLFVKCIRESREGGKRATQEVSGSGVLVSEQGEFLTNWHVVDKAVEVRCLLSDGRAFHAEVLGSDRDTDLALGRLKGLEADARLPAATLGDSEALREGDFVMAMGAPWGLSRSVSIGIVSCTRRYLPSVSEYSLWLQTDAAISPGNSGGPLVNTRGEVVGINTRGVMQGGDMGFAVPASLVRMAIDRFRANGAMNWSWTGLRLQPLRDFDRNIYFEGEEGAIVAGTDPESPARRAGLETNDRLLSVAGAPVSAGTAEDLPTLRRLLGTLPVGEPVELVLLRGAERVTVSLVPREKGDVEGKETDCPRWDFTAKAINRFDNPELHFHRAEGVFVFGVRSPGNAAGCGLRPRDILLRAGPAEVRTLQDLEGAHARALEGLKDGQTKIVLTILRDGLQREIVLDFARDFERE
jgi:serine protease Do